MMERADPSDREAFAAVLSGDGLSFRAGRNGNVQVSHAVHGPAPTLAVRRERQDPVDCQNDDMSPNFPQSSSMSVDSENLPFPRFLVVIVFSVGSSFVVNLF